MKHFKDSQGNLYAYEADGSQDHAIPKEYTAITDSEVADIHAARAQAAADALTYADKRRAEYPPVTDYLDAVVKDDQAAIAAYIAACQAVKAKYPKS
jgi:hypothetical protein